MPTPFNVSGGGGGNKSNSSQTSVNYNVEIDHEDPSKLFVDLTEIGHGNFGAVYYVSSYRIGYYLDDFM